MNFDYNDRLMAALPQHTAAEADELMGSIVYAVWEALHALDIKAEVVEQTIAPALAFIKVDRVGAVVDRSAFEQHLDRFAGVLVASAARHLDADDVVLIMAVTATMRERHLATVA